MTEYEVIRAHTGDKDYAVGDTRAARPEDVAHLIGRCLVEKKAATPLRNKAVKATENKASD